LGRGPDDAQPPKGSPITMTQARRRAAATGSRVPMLRSLSKRGSCTNSSKKVSEHSAAGQAALVLGCAHTEPSAGMRLTLSPRGAPHTCSLRTAAEQALSKCQSANPGDGIVMTLAECTGRGPGRERQTDGNDRRCHKTSCEGRSDRWATETDGDIAFCGGSVECFGSIDSSQSTYGRWSVRTGRTSFVGRAVVELRPGRAVQPRAQAVITPRSPHLDSVRMTGSTWRAIPSR